MHPVWVALMPPGWACTPGGSETPGGSCGADGICSCEVNSQRPGFTAVCAAAAAVIVTATIVESTSWPARSGFTGHPLVAGPALLGRANQHHVLLFAIVAGHQELGAAHAFLARADIADDAVERHRAAHPAAVEIPNFDAGFLRLHLRPACLLPPPTIRRSV